MKRKSVGGLPKNSRVLILRRQGAFEVYADPGVDAVKIGAVGLSLTGNLKGVKFVIVDYDADPDAEVPKEFRRLLREPACT